jgi:nucleotide-binding universal stress UspA family protein
MTDESKRIVLGFNVEFTADEVTKVAIEQAQAFGAELHVVSSVVGHQLDDDGQPAEPQARERMDRLKEQLDAAGVKYTVHLLVRERTPGKDIIAFAARNGAHLLVVGFKYRSVIGEIVFGSNYRELIAEAPCPVVTVHVHA